MKRGLLSMALLLSVVFSPMQVCGQPNHRQGTPPNIILIVVDDLGWTGLGGLMKLITFIAPPQRG